MTKGSSNNRLVVFNLPPDTTDADLERCFSEFGGLEWASMKTHSARVAYTKTAMGFVVFTDEEGAAKAVLERHEYEYRPGFKIRVEYDGANVKGITEGLWAKGDGKGGSYGKGGGKYPSFGGGKGYYKGDSYHKDSWWNPKGGKDWGKHSWDKDWHGGWGKKGFGKKESRDYSDDYRGKTSEMRGRKRSTSRRRDPSPKERRRDNSSKRDTTRRNDSKKRRTSNSPKNTRNESPAERRRDSRKRNRSGHRNTSQQRSRRPRSSRRN